MKCSKLTSVVFVVSTLVLQSCSTDKTSTAYNDPNQAVIKQADNREGEECQLGSPSLFGCFFKLF